MVKQIEVLFSPAEYAALNGRDLSSTVCVAFDIFRATTTMLTALANGAREIIPVAEIPEALALRARDADLCLAGERGGLRIRAEQTGGIDFNFGNSPREFVLEKVRDKRIAITTTNGTRALRACAHAAEVHIGALLNIAALTEAVRKSKLQNLLIVCAGTADEAAVEDTYAAGALCHALADNQTDLRDSAWIAFAAYADYGRKYPRLVNEARNGRKLSSIPELQDDVPFCLQRDTLDFTATMDRTGVIRRS